MRITVVLACLVLIGCAAREWVQEGKSRVAIREDLFVCENEASQPDGGIDYPAVAACMEKKGYQRR